MVNKAQKNGYVLASFCVLYLPLYYLSLYTAMFWYHFCALLAILLSVPLYGYVLASFCVLYLPLYYLSLYTAMFWLYRGTDNTMVNKAQNMMPKHSCIEGQTIQWSIKHKK
jgi:hypothetical protein